MTLSACQLFVETPSVGEDSLRTVLFDAASGSHRMHNYPAAVTYYRTLYRRNPNDTEALLGYARNLRFTGAPNQAVAVLQAGLGRTPNAPAILTELGKAQIAQGQAEAAVRSLALAEAQGSGDWRLYSARGIAYDMLGRYDAAQADYRRALDLEPTQVAVLNNLALSWALSGRLDAGIAALQQLAATSTNAPQARQNLALLYAMKGDTERAVQLTKQTVQPADAAANEAIFRQLAQSRDAARN